MIRNDDYFTDGLLISWFTSNTAVFITFALHRQEMEKEQINQAYIRSHTIALAVESHLAKQL